MNFDVALNQKKPVESVLAIMKCAIYMCIYSVYERSGDEMGGHGRPWEAEFTIGYITDCGRGHGRPWEVEFTIGRVVEAMGGHGRWSLQ